MKLKQLFLPLIFSLIITLFIPQAHAFAWDDPVYETWYLRSDTHTVYNTTGYNFHSDNTNSQTEWEESKSGEHDCYWFGNFSYINTNYTEIQLGSSEVRSRNNNSESIQTCEFNFTGLDFPLGSPYAIKLFVTMRIGLTENYNRTFITDPIETERIENATWALSLYTKRNYNGSYTFAYLEYGINTYNSRLATVSYQTLPPWKTMINHLGKGDLIQFAVTPWVALMGNLFYAVMTFFVLGTMYNRYGKIEPVIVFCWIFGGVGGILNAMLPIGLPIAWFLLALAFASTLYKLIV